MAAGVACTYASPRLLVGNLFVLASVRRLLLWLVVVTLALSVLYGGGLYSPSTVDVEGREARVDAACTTESQCSAIAAEEQVEDGAPLVDSTGGRRGTVLTASGETGFRWEIPTKSVRGDEKDNSETTERSRGELLEQEHDGDLREGDELAALDGGNETDIGKGDASQSVEPAEIRTTGAVGLASGQDRSQGDHTEQPGGGELPPVRVQNEREGATLTVAEKSFKPAVRGEVGYAIFHEVPPQDSEHSTLKPPPLHWSYKKLVRSLSAEDRKLLEKLRKEYKRQSTRDDPTCGTWQKAYAASHKALLDGRIRPARTATYLCRRGINCGGLADRMLGLISVFTFSLLDQRAFLASWELPMPIEALFEPVAVDWSIRTADRPGVLERERDFANGRGQEVSLIHARASLLDTTFINPPEGWDERFPENHVTFLINRGTAIRLFKGPHETRLREMGLMPETAFACAVDYLLRPLPPLLDVISRFVALFRLPSIFAVGIQIRTGDNAMMYPEADRASLQRYRHFFVCAEQVARARAAPSQAVVFFLLTDSQRLREQAEEEYRESSSDSSSTVKRHHLLVSGLPIAHIHRTADVNGAAGSIVENWAIAAADFRVISRGGYGKIAAFRSKAPNSSIVLPTSLGDSRHKVPNDCGNPLAFTPFQKMADEWSLG